MISRVHAVMYTKEADKVRAFFRDVLEFPYVDAGDGWLIFALPPAELGIHPTDEAGKHALYLMCDDINATVKALKSKGVQFCGPVKDVGFGLLTSFKMPGGDEIDIYEPKHPMPKH